MKQKPLTGSWRNFKSTINESTSDLFKKIDECATNNLNIASKNSKVKIVQPPKTEISTSLLQQLLLELKDTWGYTSEEVYDIRDKMKAYATAACIDSEVRDEAFKLD